MKMERERWVFLNDNVIEKYWQCGKLALMCGPASANC